MKIFIAGGAGFIGSHLVDDLIRDGETQVIVYDNLIRGRIHHMFHQYPNENYMFIEGDIRDLPRLEKAARGADLLIHLADFRNMARGAEIDLDYSFSTLMDGTFNILKAVVENEIPRMVYGSSVDVYAPPLNDPVGEEHVLGSSNPFGAGKIGAEMYCRVFRERYGVDISIVRLSEAYGPRNKDDLVSSWVGLARQSKEIVIQREKIMDFVPVKVAVSAIAACARMGGNQTINIGSGAAIRLSELARKIVCLADSQSKIIVQDAEPLYTAVPDIQKMKDRLGIYPPHDPLESIGELVAPNY
jgi:UDP-glucose 4-epimerase